LEITMTAILENDQKTCATPSILLASRPEDRAYAAEFVAAGQIIGGSFGSVYGLIGDGQRPSLGYDIATIKGRAQLGRPLAVCLPAARLSELIDLAQVRPSLRAWALDGPGLASSLSSRCYLRVPVRESVARRLAPHLLSSVDGVPYLQSLDPRGMAEIGEFMVGLWSAGVEFPAITSMNLSGTPEIVEYGPAMRFATAARLPALLLGPTRPRHRGSLSILTLGPSGLSLARAGTYSAAALQPTIAAPISVTVERPLG
jgi:hypothetical protein